LTSFRNFIAIAFLLLTCIACQSRKEPIALLQEQLTQDSITLDRLQDNYQDRLQEDFQWCDSMLLYVPKEHVNEYFDILNLAQAYLRQFNEMLPVMRHDHAYIRQQLRNLQNDLSSHYISDSLGMVYLNDEIASADTLHNRVLYFQDRLSTQDQALQSLKKSICKDTSK
jgi:hypothetical protein